MPLLRLTRLISFAVFANETKSCTKSLKWHWSKLFIIKQIWELISVTDVTSRSDPRALGFVLVVFTSSLQALQACPRLILTTALHAPYCYYAPTSTGGALWNDGRCLSVRLSVACLDLTRDWKGLSHRQCSIRTSVGIPETQRRKWKHILLNK